MQMGKNEIDLLYFNNLSRTLYIITLNKYTLLNKIQNNI